MHSWIWLQLFYSPACTFAFSIKVSLSTITSESTTFILDSCVFGPWRRMDSLILFSLCPTCSLLHHDTSFYWLVRWRQVVLVRFQTVLLQLSFCRGRYLFLKADRHRSECFAASGGKTLKWIYVLNTLELSIWFLHLFCFWSKKTFLVLRSRTFDLKQRPQLLDLKDFQCQ